MQKLLNTYVVGLRELGGRTEEQHLIVVFTKADQLIGQLNGRWADLRAYLIQGSVDALAQPDGYMAQLHEISELLLLFTEEELHAHEFVNAAKAHFKSTSFSIISALGTEPEGGQLSVQIVPRRILDPLLWVMEKSFSKPLPAFLRWWGF
jgi:hypothetical protein